MIEFLNMGQFSRNGHPEKEYLVVWEAVVKGQNFVDAAVRAREMLKEDDCPAVCFTVSKGGGVQTKIVDLNEESTMDNPDEPDEPAQEVGEGDRV